MIWELDYTPKPITGTKWRVGLLKMRTVFQTLGIQHWLVGDVLLGVKPTTKSVTVGIYGFNHIFTDDIIAHLEAVGFKVVGKVQIPETHILTFRYNEIVYDIYFFHHVSDSLLFNFSFGAIKKCDVAPFGSKVLAGKYFNTPRVYI